MHHTYFCSCEYQSGRRMKWQSSWFEVSCKEECKELIISGRGSMLTVILTKYSGGSCLCIPEIGIGSPLSHLSDTFWNFEQLSHLINRTDATTIAYALADYHRYKT